jgi:acetate---CoA ligase (ADP-forming)
MTRAPETDLSLFFHPRAIAVIGATDDKHKPGYALLKKVKARADRDGAMVYGVNRRLTDIDGIACFATLADVPGEVDVAVIMIGDAEKGLRDVVAKGARFAVIL